MLSKLLNRGVENSGNSMDLRLTTRIGAAWAQLQPTLPNYATLQQHECGNPGAWAHLLLTFVDVPALSPKEWFLVLRSCARSRGGGGGGAVGFVSSCCPECHSLERMYNLGAVWALRSGMALRYRCRVMPALGVGSLVVFAWEGIPDQRLCLYT